MVTSFDNWEEEIAEKLTKVFNNDEATLVRVTVILKMEKERYQPDMCSHWRTLKVSLHNTELFTKYARAMAENSKVVEKDDEFKKVLIQIYNMMLDFKENGVVIAGLNVFKKVWKMIPKEHRNSIINYVKTFVKYEIELVCGETDRASLESLKLHPNTIEAICYWWRGKISGFECGVKLVQSFSETVAITAGGATGATIGSAFGSTGAVFDFVVGAIISEAVINELNERMTKWLFGVQKDKALENAFKFFGLTESASLDEIKIAYRKKVLIHHPDKGGKAEDFYYVQINMAIIKAARGIL